jgi:hypothetical protein
LAIERFGTPIAAEDAAPSIHGMSPDDVSARVVRGGRVSWLTHPPEGVARVSAESRAFGSLRVGAPVGAPVAEETTPGELLAITHGIFMAAELADILQRRGTPAAEIVVDAHATFAGRRTARALDAVDLYVEGRVPGLGPTEFQDAVEIARRRYLVASGARSDIAGSVEHVLV